MCIERAGPAADVVTKTVYSLDGGIVHCRNDCNVVDHLLACLFSYLIFFCMSWQSEWLFTFALFALPNE